jgi:hypothetical protein
MLISEYCFTQTQDFPVNFGLMGGLNVSYMEGSEIDALQNKYKNSPAPNNFSNFGLRFAYSLQKWIEIESGAFFSGNGFDLLLETSSNTALKNSGPQTVTTKLFRKRKIVFMEFPLALRLQTPYFSRAAFRIYGFGGARFGVVTKAEEKLVENTSTSTGIQENNDKNTLQTIDLLKDRTITNPSGKQIHYTYNDFYNRTNVSLVFGAGFEKRFKIIGIFIQGQYQYGLSNFDKLSDNAKKEIENFGSDTSKLSILYPDKSEAFFRSLQLSIGLNFYIKRSDNK